MNTNKQNKTFKDSLSLEFQDSNQLFNKNGSKVTSAFMKSKGEILSKGRNSIKGNGLDGRCNQTKEAAPRPTDREINRLAEAWCELLLRQIQEEKTQLSLERAIEANKGENINRDNLEVRKIYAVTR